MPLPPGYELEVSSPPTPNGGMPAGFEPDITGRTAASKRNLDRQIATQAGPGMFPRFMERLNMPTTLEGWKQFGTQAAMSALPGGGLVNMAQNVSAAYDQNIPLLQQGEFGQVASNVLSNASPLGGVLGKMPADAATGNWAGVAGGVANVATQVPGGAAVLKGAASRAALPGRGAPIYAGPSAPGPLRAGIQTVAQKTLPGALNDIVQPFLGGGKGKVVAHQTYPHPIGPELPPAPAPVKTAAETLADFEAAPPPPYIPGAEPRALPAAPTPLPTRPPEMWTAPAPVNAPDFAIGAAPRQASVGPVTPLTAANQKRNLNQINAAPDPMAEMANRFEPGDLSSRVTGDMAPPPLNPQELAGVQSQVGQTAASMQPFEPLSSNIPKTSVVDDTIGASDGAQLPATPSMVVDVNGLNAIKQMMMERATKFNQTIDNILRPPGGEPAGTIPPGKYLQDHRTSQLAKIEAEKMGWDRENLHRPSASKGNRPVDAKRKLEIEATERNASAIDKANKKPSSGGGGSKGPK